MGTQAKLKAHPSLPLLPEYPHHVQWPLTALPPPLCLGEGISLQLLECGWLLLGKRWEEGRQEQEGL